MAIRQTNDSIADLDTYRFFIDESKRLNLRYGFRLGKVNLLIRQFTACEVLQKPTLFPIPNVPVLVEGVINLRSILVPVFNIREHLQQAPQNDNTLLLVIDKGERAFATYIEALPDCINLDDEDFDETECSQDLPKTLKPYVTKAFLRNEEIWLEVDYDAFIEGIIIE